MTALTAVAQPASAGASGCAVANSGALDADLSSLGAVTRSIALDAGDTLSVSVRGERGATASVSLVGGAGAPRTLLEDAAPAAAASFPAPQSDTYALRYGAGAQSVVSIQVRCASVQATAASAAFLARRKDLLNAEDPDRIRIGRAPTPIANPDRPLSSRVAVDEQGNARDVEFSVSLSEITAAADPRRKPEPGLLDFWAEGRMQNYDADAAALGAGNLGILYLGTSSMIGPDIKIGGLVQLDRGIETAKYGPSRMAATGWMAGPYVSMNLGSGVTFDGRAAWGATESAVSGLDAGEADRRLLRAKLTGTREVQGWKVAPSVGIVYLEDAVRDAESGDTKAMGTGRVEVLPEVSRRFDVNAHTFIEPRAALGGFVGFDEFSVLSPATEGTGDLHLKAEAGVAVGVKDGASLNATGGVESGGGSATTPENWTGRLQLNVPLGK